jgi:hypothetical protein
MAILCRTLHLLIGLGALILFVAPASAADKPASVVGTWSVTGLAYQILDTGEVTQPFGDSVRGLIQYSPGGYMTVVIQKATPASPSDTDYSDESRARIHREIIGAYTGRYSVDGNTVTHHVVAGWRPDWLGTDQVRYFDLQGDVLTIKSAPILSVVTGKRSVSILTFKRVK